MVFFQPLDNFILQKMIEIQNPLLSGIMTGITYLGSNGAIWLLIGFTFLISKKWKEAGFVLIMVILLSGLLNDLILKNIFQRLRPFDQIGGVSALIAEPSGYSFPSGHAFSSFASAYIINRYNTKLGVFTYVLALFIAISRVYLRVHFFTDVFVGAILGTIASVVIYKAFLFAKSAYLKTNIN